MLNIKSSVITGIILLASVLPASASAYFTTDQKAVQINSDTILYTVTYQFGVKAGALRMPIGAVRGLQAGDPSPYVGYTLYSDDKEVVDNGSTYSLVLSDAKVENNEYYVPQGEARSFTLVTLVKLGENFIPAEDKKMDLSLQVTSLPFTMISKKENMAMELGLRLNPTELQYYTTPEIHLKRP